MSADGLRLKIEWAKKQVSDLDIAVRKFYDSRPYEVRAEKDPQTGKPRYYMIRVDSIPDHFPLIVGDIFSNLISILDHLAYQLFLTGKTGGDGRHVYFPIARNAKTAAEYKSAAERKVEGIPQPIKDALAAVEPYQGGKGHELWVLNELNNLSKHRELIVVASRMGYVDVGPLFDEMFRKMGLTFPNISLGIAPSDPLCPLKVGDEVFGMRPDDELNENMKFGFGIAINEPKIAEAKPLIETVNHFGNLVDGIVTQFEPLL